MKTTVKRIGIKLLALFMIGLMSFSVYNKVVFLHVHKLTNGTLVEHAHPFNKSDDPGPYKSHHHSNAELLLFQNVDVLGFLSLLSFALLPVLLTAKGLFYFDTKYFVSLINLRHGRAPPIS